MVKVFDPKSFEEPELFLKLEQDGERVHLILVDKDGDKHGSGNVASISKNGISFHSCVTSAAPFKRNSSGEIYNRDKDC